MKKSTVGLDSVVVVIPYFNGSKTIERALESVRIQTVKPLEVIVVDDGSTSEESAILKKIGEKFSIKIIKQENGGQGAARNTGVYHSTSNYICFLDQDDFFSHDHIEILLSAIPKDRTKFGWAYGNISEADFEGRLIRTKFISEYSQHPKSNLHSMIGGDMFVLPSASIICREAFRAVGGFDTQFTGYEDDDLFMRLFRAGFRNFYIDIPVATWCIHAGSTSYSFRMTRSRYRYFLKLVEQFPDDLSRNSFYIRDLIVPRFQQIFRAEFRQCLKFKERFQGNELELLNLYLSFIDIALSCRLRFRKAKIKLIMRRFTVIAYIKFFIMKKKIKILTQQ